MLWPESDGQQGRASLRNALTYVNTALRAAGGRPHLISDRDTVALDPHADVWIDAWALVAPPEESLPEVVESYRGDFLAGFSLADAPEFDDWAAAQRERLHAALGESCERLVRARHGRGELAGAVATARRWVALDGLNELAHQWLIRSLLAAGDRTGAARAYEALRDMLARELDAPPAPETAALAARLKEAGPAARPRRAAGQPLEPPALPGIPLVGRGAEFAALVAAFARARQRRPCAAAVIGEAGLGKTRLATEFLTWAGAEGALVARGRAFEGGGRLPYGPLVEVLRGLGEQRPAARWRSGLAEPGRQPPGPGDGGDEAAAGGRDEAAGRAALFEAVAGDVAALAEDEPVVILVDDLQWADLATLDLLQFAARRWSEWGARVLLVLAARVDAVLGSAPLAPWLLGLGRELPLARIDLRPLGADETFELVRGLAADAPSSFGRWLYTATRGHPFYLVETLKDLLERGEIAVRPGAHGAPSVDFGGARQGAGPMPRAVREVIHARLARLSAGAMALLTAGAVLGQRSDFEALRRVADLDEAAGLAALDELLGGRLLLETGEEPTYDVAHDKIREAVYDLASLARRRVFHRRALDAVGAAASPATLAYHAAAAGATEQAIDFSLAAGDAAMRVFAAADAVQHYERAWRLAGEAAPRAELALKLGRAYEVNAEARQARALYERLVERPDLPLPAQITALSRLAVVTAQAFELDRTIGLLQRALVAAHQAGDADALAETEWSLAQTTYYAADFDAAAIYGEVALRRARELGRPELIARSLNVLAYIESARGQQRAAIALAREAHARYAELGDQPMAIDSQLHAANAELRYGDTPAGLATARAALAASRRIENRWGEVVALIQLALGSADAGDPEGAVECARQAVQLARAHQMAFLLSLAGVALAAVYRAALRLDEARTALEDVLASGVSDEVARCVRAELAAVAALAGEWDAAGEHARAALAGRLHPLMLVERPVWLEVEALARTGAVRQAGEVLRRYGEQVGDSPRQRRAYQRAEARLRALTAPSDLDSGRPLPSAHGPQQGGGG